MHEWVVMFNIYDRFKVPERCAGIRRVNRRSEKLPFCAIFRRLVRANAGLDIMRNSTGRRRP